MTPLSKRLLVALVISVAVNLLVGGILIGSAIQRSRLRSERAHTMAGPHGREHDGGARGDRGERGPREGGRGARRGGPFGGLIAGHREEVVARQKAASTARAAVRDALTHEPFDRAALERALAGLRAETATTQELLHRAIVDAAQSGDADARAKLARGFERPMGPPL